MFTINLLIKYNMSRKSSWFGHNSQKSKNTRKAITDGTTMFNSFTQDIVDTMFDDSLFDLKITLPDGENILAHKLFMIMRSPKLKRYFQRETNLPSANGVKKVQLSDVTGTISLEVADVSQAFKELKSYLYQDFVEWEVLTRRQDRFLAFIILVKRLEVKHLVGPLLETIKTYLSSVTGVDFLNKVTHLMAVEPQKDKQADEAFNGFMTDIATACVDYFRDADALSDKNIDSFKLKNLNLDSVKIILKTIYTLQPTESSKETGMLFQNESKMDPETNLQHNQEKKKFKFIINWVKNRPATELSNIEKEDLFQYVCLFKVGCELISTKIADVKRLSPKRYESVLEALLSSLVQKFVKVEGQLIQSGIYSG